MWELTLERKDMYSGHTIQRDLFKTLDDAVKRTGYDIGGFCVMPDGRLWMDQSHGPYETIAWIRKVAPAVAPAVPS